jgi:formate--tetrahydrofolate ligase
MSESDLRAPRPILTIAEQISLSENEIEPYGKYKAKVSRQASSPLSDRPSAKYVVVTGMTPTPLGEGKTVTVIGLVQALKRLGKRPIATLRQPSLGPTFGIKGGAAGGGLSQVVPADDVNLHLTGDNHAVSAAHNLLAAMVDNALFHGHGPAIDPLTISWPRVLDMSDRALRHILIGLDGNGDPLPREAAFEITAASEVMSVLSLAADLTDLRRRLGRIIVARDTEHQPVRADDLKAGGAMTALLRDALKPNLLQTSEGAAVLMHTGPFGNISTGNSSIIADKVALGLADYVCTEAGFGSDLGFEKFCDIKCRTSDLRPDAAVIVCTVRALKVQSGRHRLLAGHPLDPGLLQEDLAAVDAGLVNLEKHIQTVSQLFGVPAVVCLNHFPSDTAAEVELVRQRALAVGAVAFEVSQVYDQGGAGGLTLAKAVIDACERPNRFEFLYQLDLTAEQKIEAIATRVYGAGRVEFSNQAQEQLTRFRDEGLDDLPVCIAKTALSLSADDHQIGRPTNFTVTVKEVRAAAGAGFLIAYLGDIQTMPGLPTRPAAQDVDVDAAGRINGLL